MVIPIRELQATGEYRIPGLRVTVTGSHVRQAVEHLTSRDRLAIQRYIAGGGHGKLPPGQTLEALRKAVVEGLSNGNRTTPKGSRPPHCEK